MNIHWLYIIHRFERKRLSYISYLLYIPTFCCMYLMHMFCKMILIWILATVIYSAYYQVMYGAVKLFLNVMYIFHCVRMLPVFHCVRILHLRVAFTYPSYCSQQLDQPHINTSVHEPLIIWLGILFCCVFMLMVFKVMTFNILDTYVWLTCFLLKHGFFARNFQWLVY